eukprot:9495554-Pyramimonas_sp.AAC.1
MVITLPKDCLYRGAMSQLVSAAQSDRRGGGAPLNGPQRAAGTPPPLWRCVPPPQRWLAAPLCIGLESEKN